MGRGVSQAPRRDPGKARVLGLILRDGRVPRPPQDEALFLMVRSGCSPRLPWWRHRPIIVTLAHMIRALIAALLLIGSLAPALAAPARIIILRHGEKANQARRGPDTQRARLKGDRVEGVVHGKAPWKWDTIRRVETLIRVPSLVTGSQCMLTWPVAQAVAAGIRRGACSRA